VNPLSELARRAARSPAGERMLDWDAILCGEPSLETHAARLVRTSSVLTALARSENNDTLAALTTNPHLDAESLRILHERKYLPAALSPAIDDARAVALLALGNPTNPRLMKQTQYGHTLQSKPLTAALLGRKVHVRDLEKIVHLSHGDATVLAALREVIHMRLRGWSEHETETETETEEKARRSAQSHELVSIAYQLGLGQASIPKTTSDTLLTWLKDPKPLDTCDLVTRMAIMNISRHLHGPPLDALVKDEKLSASMKIQFIANTHLDAEAKLEWIFDLTEVGHPIVDYAADTFTAEARTREHWAAVAAILSTSGLRTSLKSTENTWEKTINILNTQAQNDEGLLPALLTHRSARCVQTALNMAGCTPELATRAPCVLAAKHYPNPVDLFAHIHQQTGARCWPVAVMLAGKNTDTLTFEALIALSADVLASEKLNDPPETSA
jgi:hypothetical protein